jgi:hypothetical protein
MRRAKIIFETVRQADANVGPPSFT